MLVSYKKGKIFLFFLFLLVLTPLIFAWNFPTTSVTVTNTTNYYNITGANITSKTCDTGDFVSAINNNTGVVTCITALAGSGDITEVNATNPALTGGGTSGSVALTVNTSYLNDTYYPRYSNPNEYYNRSLVNSTQFNSSNSVLNILESWLRSIMTNVIQNFFNQEEQLNTTGNPTFNNLSVSNLTFSDELLPDGSLCSNGQILKKTGANDWDCAADTGGTITGAGTSGFITRWNGTSSLNNSGIFELGTAIGIGTNTPGLNVANGAADFDGRILHVKDNATDTRARFILEGKFPTQTFIDLDGAANDSILHMFLDEGKMEYQSYTDVLSILVYNLLVMNLSSGNIGIGTAYSQNKLEVAGGINATGQVYSTNISITGEFLPDGSLCANNEILKKNGTNNWICATDNSGGSSLTAKNPYLYNDSTSIYGNDSYINNTYGRLASVNTWTANQNISASNLSISQNQYFCLIQNCSSYILYNSTDNTVRIR